MNRRLLLPLLLAAGISVAPAISSAAPFDNRPKILLHVRPVVSKNACAAGALANCQSASTAGQLAVPMVGPYYDVYLLVARGSAVSIAGMQCGINYQANQPSNINDHIGLDVFSWALCATLQFASGPPNIWPMPGSGNLITWDAATACQTGDNAVAGYFYAGAYSPDQMIVVPRPADNQARVARCDASSPPNLGFGDLGFAAFNAGGTGGCNPCLFNCTLPVPAHPSTWSAIKALTTGS